MHALFVDNLTVIDFAYFCPKRGIVGESLILDLTLFGELNDEGMLFDFSHVKKQIKTAVDALVDHKFVVPANHANIDIQNSADQLILNCRLDNGEFIRHLSPHQAVHLLPATEVSTKSLHLAVTECIQNIVPDNVNKIDLTLRAETIEDAYYHYAHGLKKHFGDCQRIAHGHRSRIEVETNGKRNRLLEQFVAQNWRDIYLATEADLQEEVKSDGVDYFRFGYHANQGEFSLTIAKHRCEILPTDTTVELIAEHLAQKLKLQVKDQTIRVKAYEGVDKGAIAFA